MRASYIIDGDNRIKFCHSFLNTCKTTHENLCPPFQLQEYVLANNRIGIDELLEWYRKKGYTLNLPLLGSEYEDFQECWNQLRGMDKGNYFRYRCTTESYLSGIHLLKLIRGQSLVDIGCGTGHFSALYKYYCPITIAIDAELSNLLILHRCFSADTSLICTDLNVSIGLDTMKYDSFFVSDVLHYIHNKERFLSEIAAFWNKTGLLLFNHVHHCGQLVQEEGMGEPLSISGWRALLEKQFPDAIIHFWGEHDFIKYVLGDLTELGEASECETSPVICIVSYHDYDLKKRILLPPTMRLNNSYELIFRDGEIVLNKHEMPKEFEKEFDTELFPPQFVIPEWTIPVDTLFTRGLFIPT